MMLTTSLTKAMAFSGWNLQVPFCTDRKVMELEGALEPALQLQKVCELWRPYLGPVWVAVLPHQPFVVQDILKGLARQAPARHHSQKVDW